MIIEARPGAGSNIAAEAVVRAPADGYTLLMASNANAINATLYQKLNFDFLRDITLVASVARVPLVMVVNPLFPARTVSDFITYAKANPGKINMASAGNGTPPHLAGELFQMMTSISLTPCRIEATRPHLLTSSAAKCRSTLQPCPHRLSISGPANCGHSR